MRLSIIGIATLLCTIHLSSQVSFIPPHVKKDFGEALEAIFGLGVRLQAFLQDSAVFKNENFLVSPISAALVIAQLMLGAEGDIQDNLFDLMSLPANMANRNELLVHYSKTGNNSVNLAYSKLHLQLASLMRSLKNKQSGNRSFTLETTNALFVDDGIFLKESFSYESMFLYESQLFSLDFAKPEEAYTFVNKWATEHTKGLIDTLIPAPPSPDTTSIFANAIYFLGEWEEPFSSEINQIAPFYVTKDKTVNVTFMSNLLEEIPYTEHKELNCMMVVLPYKNRDLGMYLVMPKKGHKYEHDIKSFAKDAKTSDFLEMLDTLKNKSVILTLPKFSLSTSISVLKPLQRYISYKKAVRDNFIVKGDVLDVLDNKIDLFTRFRSTNYNDVILTNAADNANLVVSDIVQQMSFSINEKGTEAAAVTAGLMDYSGGAKSFYANRPFMFFIRHEATGATLFWGTISNPKS